MEAPLCGVAPEDAEDEGFGEPERRIESTPRYVWHVIRAAVDYMTLNTETGRDLIMRAQPYPDPFVHSHLTAHAGAELGCWVGMRDEEAPMIVFVPGTFATKDASNTRDKVMTLYERTQAHLCALDLRGFGHSSDLHSTGGYLEGLDIAEIARRFGEDERVSSVILTGESLGASTCLLAAGHAGSDVDGVLAVNPFADLDWMIRLLSSPPPRWHASNVVHHAFARFLRHVAGASEARFDTYLERMAEIAGLSAPQLTYRASPRFHVQDIEAPALILHAVDDVVIPPFHAHVLRGASESNPNVEVHLTEMGGHTTFNVWDETWYWATVDAFLDDVLGGSGGDAS